MYPGPVQCPVCDGLSAKWSNYEQVREFLDSLKRDTDGNAKSSGDVVLGKTQQSSGGLIRE